MYEKAYLILENGEVFEGKSFGAKGEITGELVFATGMIGYLETLTDPSYYGQIVMQTFPLIGNYGVIPSDFENSGIAGAGGYITKYPCKNPSNFRSEKNIDTFLREQGVIGLCGIDTRRLTKIIRNNGVMNAKICTAEPSAEDQAETKNYTIKNAIGAVTAKTIEKISSSQSNTSDYCRIALINLGARRSIINSITAHNCEVWSFPCFSSAKEILEIQPHGIIISNGPGDPADSCNKPIIETIRELDKSGIPIFGICMGHQLLALAKGYKTKKLKFGHRGANHPVKDTRTGNIYITNQNHGYEVIPNKNSEISFINVNDKGCEGLDYGKSFSVQFHPNDFLFDEFFYKRIGS